MTAVSEPVDVLRRAASLIRERAQAATPGPWHVVLPLVGGMADVGTTPDPDEGQAIAAATTASSACLIEDAAHIASWHPQVALAVADWLDDEAAAAARAQEIFGRPVVGERQLRPLAVARAYLGEA